MGYRKLLSIITGLIYLLTTQLVVHAFTMYEMGPSNHSAQSSHHSAALDTSSHIGTNVQEYHQGHPSHQTDCISTINTISRAPAVSEDCYHIHDGFVLARVEYDHDLAPQESATHSHNICGPPGRSDFVDHHYGHGVVMHC